jgi:hypothetical protein
MSIAPASAATPTAPRPSSVRQNLVFSAVAVTLVFLVLEGAASVFLATRQAKHALRMEEESHADYDADLGWVSRADIHIESLYGPGISFTTNARGFRGTENHTPEIPPGRFRVVCLGDSFTMGFGVDDAQSYPAQMQAACPRAQTVNMGEGGYGIDQAYLWYKREGVKLQTDVLLFAFIPHDFYRMARADFIGYPKPVLRAKNGALAVENVPVPHRWAGRTAKRRGLELVQSLSLSRSLAWLVRRIRFGSGVERPDQTFYGAVGDDTLAAAGLAFQDLAQLSQARGQQFVLVYLPSLDLLPQEPTRESQWLQDYAREHGLRVFNLVEEFGRLPPWEIARLFRPDDGHYTPEGNRFVAEALLRRLRELRPAEFECGNNH